MAGRKSGGGEKTSPSVASKASAVLRNPSSSGMARTLAGAALAQAGTAKASSARTASTAAKALNDGRASSTTQSLAGSVMTQRPGKRGK